MQKIMMGMTMSFLKGCSAVLIGALTFAGNASAAAQAPCNLESLAKGKLFFNQCAACHSSKPGEAAGVGPNLYDIVGRRAATVPNYTYSRAMRSSGIVWSADRLSEFIAGPRLVVKGTTMGYGGMRKPQDRASLICYLNSPAMRSQK